MASLSDLVSAVSAVVGLPEATVFAYGRFARQAGHISQKGRGRSAAPMSLRDAANLIIAVAGTGVTREAGFAVEKFRSMRRGRIYDFSGGYEPVFLEWLKPIGVREVAKGEFGNYYELRADFGHVLEFLITTTLNGELASLFQRIPVAEVPPHLWTKWKRENSIHLQESVDYLIEQGLLEPKPPDQLIFGEDISLEINFSRLVPAIEIEFRRMWDSPQTAFLICFGPMRGAQAHGAHRLRLMATLTQHTLAGVGLILNNMVRANALYSSRPMDVLFAKQMRQRETRPQTAR